MMDPTYFQIADHKSPIVVLFGPPASGKTMALIRLTRYLMYRGVRVIPDTCFRPYDDSHYKAICDSLFDEMCYGIYAAKSVTGYDLLLARVHDKKGKVVCQILDVSGMYCFDRNRPEEQFFWPEWFNYLRRLPNKRIWSFFVEEGWEDPHTRLMYLDRIHRLAYTMSKIDKSIFVCSKVDEHPQVILGNGMPNKKQIFKNIMNDYPGIFIPFENRTPITRLFRKYNIQCVPFSSGDFYPTETGKVLYNMGQDVYPKMLWEAILQNIK